MPSYPPRQKVRHYDTDEVKVRVSHISSCKMLKKLVVPTAFAPLLKNTFNYMGVLDVLSCKHG